MAVRTKAVFDSTPSARELENRDVAYRAALEGIVLLENDGTLPLSPCKAAVFGAGVRRTIKGGTGSGEVNERASLTFAEGLAAAGFELCGDAWLDDYDELFAVKMQEHIQFMKQVGHKDFGGEPGFLAYPFKYPNGRAVTPADIAASQAELCFYVLARQAGESNDRKIEDNDFGLTAEEYESIRLCAESYNKMIVVINSGASVDMSFVDDIPGINAVVYLCQQGMEGCRAFADIITGKYSPSGRLAATWPMKYADWHCADEFSHRNGDLQHEYYRDGIYVGYRYFDTFSVKPRYEFGYGLGYADFDIAPGAVKVSGSTVELSAVVTNLSAVYSGRQVVQLYASCPTVKLAREAQSLAAFVKTATLAPGETAEVILSFDMAQLAAYDQQRSAFILEAGDYVLYVGESSRKHVPVAVIALDSEVITEQCCAVCTPEVPVDEIVPPATLRSIPADVPHIAVDSGEFSTVRHEYVIPPVYSSPLVDEIMAQLSPRERAQVVIGSGKGEEELFSAIGEDWFSATGSAAHTTSAFVDKGLIDVALADGPAGLRLRRETYITAEGRIRPEQQVLGVPAGWIEKHPQEGDRTVYQYATAFPVATALAQSWNTDLLEQMGDAVGREMEEYGVTYWLAPGMNIQRNPLCGRNFEYYSEDPLISGKMAAAVTRGVQKRSGQYVTIKHFACNNQEDNRHYVSSDINERALREIYLRGFAIAVREGGAKSLMTSYNKINRVYAPNRFDLLTWVLRCEWGFDGVVMTDWRSTGGDRGSNALAMSAGNDMLMPGAPQDVEDILAGIADGTISQTDLDRCCANVIRLNVESRLYQEYKAGTIPVIE